MTSVALIDYDHPLDGFANRDVTGTFGSAMHARGVMGSLITRLKKGGLRAPNLTLAYLKGIAEQHGVEASHYTGMPDGEDVVIIASSMYQYKNEVDLARQIRKRHPRSRIGFTGAFSSSKPEFFEADADFIFKGEPEVGFRKLCEGQLAPRGVIDLKEQTDVTTLPFPNWDGIDLKTCGYFPALKRKPFLTIQGSRGCPFACDFCPYMVMQKPRLRRRTNASIMEEIRYLIDRYGIRSLLFTDIVFSLRKDLTKQLCRMIESERLDLDIGCETRLDCVDEEMVDLMAAAGFKAINVGIESPEEDILKGSGRRPIARQKTESMIDRLEKSGIRVQAFYILGLVGDNDRSIRNTIRYSRRLNTFTAQFGILTPFPGTKSAESLHDRISTHDYSRYTEYDPVVRLDGISPDEISRLKDRAFGGYYMRPAWLRKHGPGLLRGLLKHSPGCSKSPGKTTPKITSYRKVVNVGHDVVAAALYKGKNPPPSRSGSHREAIPQLGAGF